LRREGAEEAKIRKPRAKRPRDEKKKFDLFGDFDKACFEQKSVRMKKKVEANLDLTRFLINFDFEESKDKKSEFRYSKFALRPFVGYQRKRSLVVKTPNLENHESIVVSDDEIDEMPADIPPPLSDDEAPLQGELFQPK